MDEEIPNASIARWIEELLGPMADSDAAKRSLVTCKGFCAGFLQQPNDEFDYGEVPMNERWQPHAETRRPPMQAGELIYAVLGPRTSQDLLRCLQSDPEPSDAIADLRHQLDEAIGRFPPMLAALATAVGASQRWEMRDRSGEGIEPTAVDRLLPEAVKHLGGLLMEAWEAFGFDHDSFARWLGETSMLFFDSGNWPPRGIGYEQFDLRNVVPPESIEPDKDDVRFEILEDLRARYGLRVGEFPVEHSPNLHDVRTLARLTAMTAQWWRWMLADKDRRPRSGYEDDNFTYTLLEAMLGLDGQVWELLTDSRRVCFAADLGELLRSVQEIGGGDVEIRAADLIHVVCGDSALLDVAERAGGDLAYPASEAEFRNRMRQLRTIASCDS